MQSDVFSWSIFEAGTNLILISVHQKSNVTELLVMLAIGCVEPERVFLIIWIHGLSLAVVVQDHIFSSHGGYMIVCVFPILWLIYIHRISSKAKNMQEEMLSFLSFSIGSLGRDQERDFKIRGRDLSFWLFYTLAPATIAPW